MPWTRVGVRLIPKGHSANRSLSAIEPVSATAKRKLENGEQRPVPEIYPARAEIPKITGQRLGSASVTRGNVAGSHTPGNITPETRLPGWGGRIRTNDLLIKSHSLEELSSVALEGRGVAPATANRIVNGEQRPAPEIYPRGPKYRKLPARDWDPPA